MPEYLILDAREGVFRLDLYGLDAEGRYRPAPAAAAGRVRSAVLPGCWLDPSWFEEDPLPDAEDVLLELAADAYPAWIAAKRERRQHERR